MIPSKMVRDLGKPKESELSTWKSRAENLEILCDVKESVIKEKCAETVKLMRDLAKAEAERDTLKARCEKFVERINNYLGAGGLFNPEMMEHDKVRNLLIDIRDGLDELRKQGEEKK